MNYQKKYWYQFGTLDGKINRVELWQNTATVLTAEEVKGAVMPFSVEMPELNHKFQVVRGTGCEINLISMTDGKFFDGLYHTDMKEFMVKHYIDDVINWIGYLNSEMVRETYSEASKYPFQITGNDGFALLDRLHFVDLSGDHYLGIKSIADILQIILNRIGLPFEYLFISMSTTFTGQSGASNSTVFHETYVDTANFYNEDEEPETMRKVLESVLAPFGGIVTQVGGNIYITDIHTLAVAQGDSIIWKKFTFEAGDLAGTVVNNVPSGPAVYQQFTITLSGTGGQAEIDIMGVKHNAIFDTSLTLTAQNFVTDYTGVYSVDLTCSDEHIYITCRGVGESIPSPKIANIVQSLLYLESVMITSDIDIPDIGYMGTDSERERSGGKNKQIVVYSPYPKKTILPVSLIGVEEFTTVPADYTTIGDHTFKVLEGNTVFQELNGAQFEIGYDIIGGVKSDERVYLRWFNNQSKLKIAELKFNPDVSISKIQDFSTVDKKILKGAGLLITADLYIRSTDETITSIWLNIDVAIGSRHAYEQQNATNGWAASHTDYRPYEIASDSQNIRQKWVNVNPVGSNFAYWLVPIDEDLSGQLFVDIYSDFMVQRANDYHLINYPSYVSELRLSNLQVRLVDIQTGQEVSDKDIEYWGYLNPDFKDEAEKIELICGTDAASADRGKLMSKAAGVYSSIMEWTRASQTFKIEELLLNSLSSNYRFGYLTLNNMKLKNNFNQLNLITDTTFMSLKWFMVKSMKKNFRDNLVETTLIEIAPDELTIVK